MSEETDHQHDLVHEQFGRVEPGQGVTVAVDHVWCRYHPEPGVVGLRLIEPNGDQPSVLMSAESALELANRLLAAAAQILTDRARRATDNQAADAARKIMQGVDLDGELEALLGDAD